MADETFVVRFSEEQRRRICDWCDLSSSAVAELLDRLENAVDLHVQMVAECESWPTPKDCREAIQAIQEALAPMRDLLNTNAAFIGLRGLTPDGASAEQIDQAIESWQGHLAKQEALWASIVQRGRPPKIHRDMLLDRLCTILDEADVEREDQVFVLRYLCEMVGADLPSETSKLNALLAVIRCEQP